MQPTSYSSYPPYQVQQKTQGLLTILQLTDLHLLSCDCGSDTCYHNHGQSFRDCLQQALSERKLVDLIIITGDLIHEMNSKIYDYVFSVLEKTGIPFVCIAGNHDVTDEVGEEFMMFDEYEFVSYLPDKRLVHCHSVESEHWQVLFMDSSNPGRVSGLLSEKSLQWLDNQLTKNHKPAILCLHHHVEPINSGWIDRYMLINADTLWQKILPFSHIKAVVHGHVHQEYNSQRQHVQIFSAPATSYQFKPNSDRFTLDTATASGYRWLLLLDDGNIESSVQRLNQALN